MEMPAPKLPSYVGAGSDAVGLAPHERLPTVPGLHRIARLATAGLGATAQLVEIEGVRTRLVAGRRDAGVIPLDTAIEIIQAGEPTVVRSPGGQRWVGVSVTAARPTVLCAPDADLDGRTALLLRDLAALTSDVLHMSDADDELRQLRELIGATTHDLRNPLSVLRAGLETLAEHRDALQPSQQERIAGLAMRQARRMAGMLDDLLAMHGIEDGTEFVDVDLVTIVRDVLDGSRLIHRFVDLDSGPSLPDTPVVVRGVPDALSRLVTNLVTNAAIHGGGRVVIRLRSDEDHARLTIRDNGPGMPDDTALDSDQVERTAGGHGLGLVIARRLVDAHRGRISHWDGPQGGTVLEVRIPLAESLHD